MSEVTVTQVHLSALITKEKAMHLTLRKNKHGFYFSNALNPLSGNIHIGRTLKGVDMQALTSKVNASTPSKADLETMKSELSHSIAEHTKRIVMLAQMADADDELVALAEALNEQKRRLAVVVDLLC